MSPRDREVPVTREMPFGKHRGRIIADLPGNYLNGFARKGFPAGEIGRLLALMQEIDHSGLTDIRTQPGSDRAIFSRGLIKPYFRRTARRPIGRVAGLCSPARWGEMFEAALRALGRIKLGRIRPCIAFD